MKPDPYAGAFADVDVERDVTGGAGLTRMAVTSMDVG